MPLSDKVLNRKFLKDIDDFSTSEPTHTKHTARMTRMGCYKFKYSGIDSQHGERDDRGGLESSGMHTAEGGWDI